MTEPRFLHDIVERLADVAAHRSVIADSGSALDGRGLEQAVAKCAHAFAGLGVGPGDRVMVALPNSVALAVVILASSRVGATAVPINPRLTASEQAAIRAHALPRLFLAAAANSPTRLTLPGAHGRLTVEVDAVTPPDETVAEPAQPVAVIIYTSGTTGEPKGVMLTHANLLFVAQRSSAIRKLGVVDRVYGVLPMSHVFGLASVFLGSLYAGARLDLVAEFDAAAVARAFDTDGITIFQGVPTMYQRLLECAERAGGRLPAPALRYISSGGAPLDLGLKARVEALFRRPLHNGYGLTETSPTVTTTRMEDPASDDSVGTLLAGIAVRIVDAAAGKDAPPGAVGEIWVRGANVMKGYYRAEAATRAVITADGWFKSGDLGRMDARGHLYIAGRAKELIIRSGFNVYPPEVEAVLTLHPHVALAGVVGRRVAGNEEVVAFIEAKPGLTLVVAAIAAFAAERLAPYKRPGRYVVLPALPVTGASKIRKAELAQIAASLGDEAP